MKNLFIRIDTIGQWKDTEHISYFGLVEEDHSEKGISCYELTEGAIKQLYFYWKNDVYDTSSEGRQLTIFEGEKIGMGSSMEDLATCERTIAELPASMLFDNIEFFQDVEDGYEYYDEEEEYEISLNDDMFEGLDKFEIVEKSILKAVGI